ncbi:MAG: tRNA (cytidine(34)-2'-O)-methyltransferase [Acidobacteria bacterium]|nr:tRNA (cytidine(34)-2'-O)-methyltransferase [Acidobacteriota bacterium]
MRSLSYGDSLNIVLHEPEIPGNTGSVGRLCVGLDATLTLIEPLGYSLDDRYLKRAGLDYWPYLKWRVMPDWSAFQDAAGPEARVFMFTTKTDKPYTSAEYRKGDFLVFGKETKGLPESLRADNAERCLTLPMFGPIRSLNLAMSVGVVAYEAMRQITDGFA